MFESILKVKSRDAQELEKDAFIGPLTREFQAKSFKSQNFQTKFQKSEEVASLSQKFRSWSSELIWLIWILASQIKVLNGYLSTILCFGSEQNSCDSVVKKRWPQSGQPSPDRKHFGNDSHHFRNRQSEKDLLNFCLRSYHKLYLRTVACDPQVVDVYWTIQFASQWRNCWHNWVTSCNLQVVSNLELGNSNCLELLRTGYNWIMTESAVSMCWFNTLVEIKVPTSQLGLIIEKMLPNFRSIEWPDLTFILSTLANLADFNQPKSPNFHCHHLNHLNQSLLISLLISRSLCRQAFS